MVSLSDKGKEKACDSAWGLSVTLSPLLWPTWECINLNFVFAPTRYRSVLLSTFLPRWWNLCSRTVAKVNPNSLVCHCLLPKPCYYFNSEAWRPQVVTLWIIASFTPGMWQLLSKGDRMLTWGDTLDNVLFWLSMWNRCTERALQLDMATRCVELTERHYWLYPSDRMIAIQWPPLIWAALSHDKVQVFKWEAIRDGHTTFPTSHFWSWCRKTLLSQHETPNKHCHASNY